jgi:ribonuclease BN (tRNA processing enzyme)
MLGHVGIELGQVRRVLLSHFHLDHCLDLFAFAFARNNPGFAPAPRLEIHGPPGLAGLVRSTSEALGPWARDPDARIHEVELDGAGRGEFAAGDLVLRCVRTEHTRESLAWRVTLQDGRSIAYSGDSGENPAVAELSKGVDLLVLECSFPDAEATPKHLSPSSAGRLAALAQPAKLVLSHFYPANDPLEARRIAARHFGGPIELAHDGSVHAIGA